MTNYDYMMNQIADDLYGRPVNELSIAEFETVYNEYSTYTANIYNK